MSIEKTERPGYRASVRRIQTALYEISQTDPNVMRVNPDGIYGENTAEAVRGFQRLHDLEVTGRVDFITWRKLLSEEKTAMELLAPLAEISPFSVILKDGKVTEGDRSDTVMFIKLMLQALSIEYDFPDGISDSKLYDAGTAAAISRFQLIHGLDDTGITDKATWNALARAYNKCARYAW